jgi:hypothetical protein
MEKGNRVRKIWMKSSDNDEKESKSDEKEHGISSVVEPEPEP